MKMQVLDHGFVELIDSMPSAMANEQHRFVYLEQAKSWGAGDVRVVQAARLSVGGQRPIRDDQKLLKYLFDNRHTSPFEKVRFEFHVRLPIFVARQWIRHRMGSFNEQSARYSVLDGDYYVPTVERIMNGAQSTTNKQGSQAGISEADAIAMQDTIRDLSSQALERYEGLLNGGLARELARMVLPVNFYTQWYWTVDLHNLLHFLRLRVHSHAQHEIQVYGQAILVLIEPLVPYTVSLFKESLR